MAASLIRDSLILRIPTFVPFVLGWTGDVATYPCADANFLGVVDPPRDRCRIVTLALSRPLAGGTDQTLGT